jgi:23S rRNA pseudouridine2457 synthase
VELWTDPVELPDRPVPIRFRKNVPTAWLQLILREGRNRQVRRMTASVGHPTLRLVRMAIGSVGLDDLVPGEYRELTEDELRSLRNA